MWLSSIGRYVSPAVTSSDDHKDWVIVTEPYDPDLDGYVGIWAKTPKSPAFIDCGENIELFKALAAMNDENYNEQYFVTELAGSSYCVHKNRNTNLAYSLTCRKATVAEIIEYFKKSEK